MPGASPPVPVAQPTNFWNSVAERELWTRIRFFGAAVIWLASSIQLTVMLKELLDPEYLGFTFPLIITVFSFFFAFILMATFSQAPDMLWTKGKTIIKEVALPLGFWTAAEVATSNLSYPLVSLSLMHVVKCSSVVTTLLGGFALGVEAPNMYLIVLMTLLVVGVTLACKDLYIKSWAGLFWMSLSTIAFSAKSLHTQKLGTRFALSPRELSYLVMPSAGVLLLPCAVGVEAFALPSWQPRQIWTAQMELKFVVKAIGVPVLAFINTMMLFEIIQSSSSLSMSVLVAFRQLLGIMAGIVLFSEKWTIKAWLGIFLALCVTIEYGRYRSNSVAEGASRAHFAVEDDYGDEEETPLLPSPQSSQSVRQQ